MDPGASPFSLKVKYWTLRGLNCQMKTGSGSWCITRCQVVDPGGSTSSLEVW